MGDSEAVAAEESNLMEYPSKNFASTGYYESSLNGVADTSAAMTDSVGASIGDPADGSYSVNYPIAYGGDPNAVMQASQLNASYDGDQMGAVADTNQVAAGSGSTGMETSQVAGYSSAVNGSVTGVTASTGVDNGITSGNGDGSVEEKQVADGLVLPMSAEEERLWNIVRANSLDFTAWTTLIEETEKVAESNILKIRKVYDTFLEEFPLCYGYWKKYADHEARLGSIDKVVEVYERAVQGVTYSVDIWLHYCIFAIATYDDPDTIRSMPATVAPCFCGGKVWLFERGLAYVGSDYLSFTLWDKYIEYECMYAEWARLAMIYTRILENPNQQLDRYFNSFKELAASRPLSELRSADEAAAAASNVSDTLITNTESGAGDHPSEEEVSPGMDEQAKNVSVGLTEAEELEKYIAVRDEMYKKAKEFDSKIIGFETAIRRPYFHVRPLNVVELENWHNYLDFIEKEGDFSKVVKLYERCVIACANYPEYWIRYVSCMEASRSVELANNALDRATQVFVKRQPEIHLFAARFKEQTGDITGARGAYQLVHAEISPGLLEAIIRHANMEHRLGNLEDAYTLYEQAIAIEKGKEHSQTLPMLYAQYARFIYLASGNTEKARAILVMSLEHVQLTKPLLEAIIHLEAIQALPKKVDIAFLDSLVEKFIDPNAENLNVSSTAEREELSSIYLEFVNLFGDIQLIKKAEDRHAKFFLCHRSMSELKKRHADDYLASDKAKIAKSYSVQSPAQSVAGSYPSAQNQWAANYGVSAQTWPPVAQAQGQQWQPGYTQQAAYGGYPGYGSSYANPTMSAAVPQAVAYGAYPTAAYPSQQAVPQQNYGQPVAAAPVTPTQQPASVPQAYYGTYYNS